MNKEHRERKKKFINFNDYLVHIRRRLLNDSHRKCEEKKSNI